METLTALTVGGWAERSLRAILVLEKYDIHPHKDQDLSLEEACSQRGLDVAQLTAELQQATAPRHAAEGDWAGMPLSALTAHLVKRHHEYLKLELPRLRKKLAFMTSRHGERDNNLLIRLNDVYVALHDELDGHLRKEEMILFPLIESYERSQKAGVPAQRFHCGSVMGPITVMEHEHANATDALQQLRQITNNYTPPSYACPNFRGVWASLAELDADLVEHIRLENGFLHPRAAKLESELFA